MSWNVHFAASGFPPTIQSALPSTLTVNACDLFWGAITLGRPNLSAVYAHGRHSIDEALYRWCMITANLTVYMRTTGLHNSAAFNSLDPTEKAWVNFSLGMVFTKIFAAKLLNMPWLMHFKWFQAQVPVTMAPGGSTPDFIGFDPRAGQYHVLEAKGRSGGFSSGILNQAKQQAQQAIDVAGNACGMHIGSLLYRQAQQRVAMAMVDPTPKDGERWELEATRETWAEYYRLAWGLYNLPDPARDMFQEMTGARVDFDEVAFPFIAVLMGEGEYGNWTAARDELIDWSKSRLFREDAGGSHEVADRHTFADGLRITLKNFDDRLGLESR